mmetsp:Transcript_34859/g.76055  ORF Transcript_34859/g.76055 Transcript_34859/m.76055 type:complete len:397 (+) Transcript_34859:83-1273(+)
MAWQRVGLRHRTLIAQMCLASIASIEALHIKSQEEPTSSWLSAVGCALEQDSELEVVNELQNLAWQPAVSAPDISCSTTTSLAVNTQYESQADGELQRLDFVSLGGKEAEQQPKTVVWITGYARSGTSTALSMVTSAGEKVTPQGKDPDGTVFALFEPCHWGWWIWNRDRLDGSLREKGCSGLLTSLSQCDFTGVRSLYNWGNSHSVTPGVSSYTPQDAEASCSEAELTVFKTIYYGHDLAEKAIPMLEADERLKVISIVRDPRGIFASWRTTWPFTYKVSRNLLVDICDKQASNLNVNHPRIHKIVFEELVTNPTSVVRSTFEFLGLPFGQRQLDWIKSTFSASCDGTEDEYNDCKSNSTSHIEKWASVMVKEEQDFFSGYENCRAVAMAYGYPL